MIMQDSGIHIGRTVSFAEYILAMFFSETVTTEVDKNLLQN